MSSSWMRKPVGECPSSLCRKTATLFSKNSGTTCNILRDAIVPGNGPACYLSGFRRDAMETTFSNRRPADTMCTLMKKMHSFESTKNPTRNVELRLVRVQSEHNASR